MKKRLREKTREREKNQKSSDEDAGKALGGYDRGLYVERWTEFVKELAVIVGRGRDGSISCYPVVETIHKDNICHIVEAPADVSEDKKKQAIDVALKAVESLEGAGVFAVELFLSKDGKVLLNEVAPRPHNSGHHTIGHHTIESCYTSRYEQHLRAVIGLPLGDPSMKAPAAIMYNILGEDEMPKGIPVATVAIGNATNAALLAVRILGATDSDLWDRLMKYQEGMKDTVLRKAEKLEVDGWEKYLNP